MMDFQNPLSDELPGNFSPPRPQDLGEEVNDSLAEPLVPTIPVIQRTFQFASVAADGTAGGFNAFDCGFNAKSMVIDNFSGRWWFCLQINQYIPPWTHGMIRNVTAGSQVFNINAQTPAGRGTVFNAAHGLAITVYSVNQPPTDGVVSALVP